MKYYFFILLVFSVTQFLNAQTENLLVENNATDGIPIAVRGQSTGANQGTFTESGVLGESYGTGDGWNAGVYGFTNGQGGPQIGVLGNTTSDIGLSRWGVLGQAVSQSANGTGYHTGVQGEIFGSSNASRRIAVAGVVTDNATANGAMWAGWFDGDVCVLGTVFHDGLSSSHSLLSNTKSEVSVLPRLSMLDVNTYTDLKKKDMKFGFNQDVLEKHFPSLVSTFDNPKYDPETKEVLSVQEVRGIDYNGMIVVLTKALQEQQSMIETLSAEVKKLKSKLNK